MILFCFVFLGKRQGKQPDKKITKKKYEIKKRFDAKERFKQKNVQKEKNDNKNPFFIGIHTIHTSKKRIISFLIFIYSTKNPSLNILRRLIMKRSRIKRLFRESIRQSSHKILDNFVSLGVQNHQFILFGVFLGHFHLSRGRRKSKKKKKRK